ncbi:MAG: GNAT family N-acetyltransferase [Acetanaerobacterium sp.]
MTELSHKSTVRIETGRLVLRRFTLEDAGAMYRNWAGDAEVTQYLTWCAHMDEQESRDILKNVFLPAYETDEGYEWAIELKDLGEPIGSIGVHDMSACIQSASVGYCIGRGFWGSGYVLEALNAVIRFLCGEVGFNRVEALHDVENVRSGRVMKKAGMQYEGIRRAACLSNRGEPVDCCVYAILKKDPVLDGVLHRGE